MTRMLGHALVATAALASLAAVAACGGGGGQSGLPGGATQAQATFTIAVPSGTSTSSRGRAPAFVSPNAQSIAVAVGGGVTTANLTPASPNCTPANAGVPLTCTVTLYAPPGNDTFVLTLYAGLNATGSVLATSTVSAAVSASQPTIVPVTLGGVVASIAVSVTGGNDVVPGGFATTLPVSVTAKDASGATIVGPGSYSNPIALTDADTSGVTTLSTATVTSPLTVVTLAYAPTDANSGVLAVSGLPVGETTIGASAVGVPASAVTSGTFQYIADRFSGFGHTRTLSGTAAVTVTTYNGAGVPSPNPSAWSYTMSDSVITHSSADIVATVGAAAASAGTVQTHHAITYTQTSPVTATAPESHTEDTFRRVTLTPAGAIFYVANQNDVNVNAGAASSPITGNVSGTVGIAYTYPATGVGWETDVLPHATATWSNSNVPYSETYTNAEIATFQQFADGSTAFTETVPHVVTQSQTAAGAGSNFDGTTGVTTTISVPGGATIPMAQQTTSPVAGAITSYTVPNWYPGGAAPVQPLYSYQYGESKGPIPGACNVPATIATQAFALVETTAALEVPNFRYRQDTTTDCYVQSGGGWVCEIYIQTSTTYRFSTGIVSSQTVTTHTIGVTSAANL